MRKLLRKFGRECLLLLVYLIFRVVYATCRFVSIDEFNRDLSKTYHSKSGYLLACWHEHLIMATLGQVGIPFRALASRSFSGKLMGGILEKFGFTPVYGSKNLPGKQKGGPEARTNLLNVLDSGNPVAITVDGSTGPRRYVKAGIVDLSKKSSSAILPVGCRADRFWELNTWDRLKIPKPFSKIYLAYGEPIIVPTSAEGSEFLEYQTRVENSLNQLEQRAECFMENLLVQNQHSLSS